MSEVDEDVVVGLVEEAVVVEVPFEGADFLGGLVVREVFVEARSDLGAPRD